MESKGHKQIPNVSLVPENDPTLLYVNSGMFPLVPYLSGQPHPLGKRIMNVQRCLRFDQDIDNVGNTNRHTSAFHMIGNWSLGDYFKEQQLSNIFEYYVEELGLDINKLYASVFAGDADASKDEESIRILVEIYKKYGVDAKGGERIFAFGKDENWWQRGDAIGELGGPDSEVFYYIGEDGDGLGKSPYDFEDEFLEIGNSVFMQYTRTETGWGELPQKNVDYGGGLERQTMVVQGKDDVFETDMFWPVIEKLEELSGKKYKSEWEVTKAMRVIADHMRAGTLLAMDGVKPSNKELGYILRQIIRRMVRAAYALDLKDELGSALAPVVVQMLSWLYPELAENEGTITDTFSNEELRFRKTIDAGAKLVEKRVNLNSDLYTIQDTAFELYTSTGYPVEFYVDDIKRIGVEFDEEKFMQNFMAKITEHRDLSRAGAEQKFKGGLAEHSEQTTRYHTATHLLHMALRKVLGGQVSQQGSNITGERLRFDFNYDKKLDANQLKQITEIINDAVDQKLAVSFVELDKDEALQTGALHNFNEKYGDRVTVYYIGNSLEEAVSKEFCGGPHVENTGDIGHVEIFKQKKIGENLLRFYVRGVS